MDKSMLGDLQSLSEEDNVRMAAMIDQLQIRDRLDFTKFYMFLYFSITNLVINTIFELIRIMGFSFQA